MADARTTFDLVIVNPDSVVYEGEAKKLIAPGIYQDIAILPDHTPLYAQLEPGELRYVMGNGVEKKQSIEGGILRVRLNKVSVVIGFDIGKPAKDSS